ncbi:uncharacterized protein PV09_08698 [Verruconis gallopava]|uniref:Uncharacterized protein n=1 Tax=Verruconis gallopava TaxID=253628 RepID=A0A0D2AKT6_9PEZI|nr:uncharacterized protein PV09_08698 [Verruconis gallopava]KIV99633.1 hypothetical protein PV09_08698 [Verruconis gallopava]
MAVQQPAEAPSLPDDFHSLTSGSFASRKSLPHPLPPTAEHPIIFAQTNGKPTASSGSPKSLRRTYNYGNSNGASLPSTSIPGTFPLNGFFDTSLPPTPPRNGNEHARSFSSPVRPPGQDGVLTSSHRSTSHNGSLGGRSPPTPDQTPPATASLDTPAPPAQAAFSPSSLADSFRTAREEQWSSDEGGEDDLNDEFSLAGPVRTLRRSSCDTGFGMGLERDDDSTPTPRKLRQKQTVRNKEPTKLPLTFDVNAIPDREWDTNLMRNVTVRRKKRPVLEDEERVAAREIVPRLVNGSSEDDDGPEPLTPNFDHFARTMPGMQRTEDNAKRLSGSSHASTILEAYVVPTSPRRHRTLRHTSKNASLRSDDGSSSRPSSSNHAPSLASDDLSFSQLNERLRAEHNSRLNSVNGATSPDLPSVVPAVPLRHHPESRSLRLASISSSSSGTRRASDGAQPSFSTSPARHRTVSAGSYSVSSFSGLEHPGRLSYVPGVEPFRLKHDTAARQIAPSSADLVAQQLARAATRRALQRLDSSGGTIDARPGSFLREPHRQVSGLGPTIQDSLHEREPNLEAETPDDEIDNPGRERVVEPMREPANEPTNAGARSPTQAPARAQMKDAGEAPNDHVKELAPAIEFPTSVETTTAVVTTTEVSSQSIIKRRTQPVDLAQPDSRSTADSMPRVSFDNSTVTAHEIHRVSNASSTPRADTDHANPRHLYAQSTPFSQISEHEIREANAINIYPHNNKSLLVVQQVARPSGAQKQNDAADAISGWPALMVSPATPPQVFSASPVNVDSPLKNPRRPPQPPHPVPPKISIHPATPDHELDRISFTEKPEQGESDPPLRSLSFKQKARRYSDQVMKPIITRTSSLRRSYYRRSRARREGAPTPSAHDSRPESHSLHPFWQPRGFWDEFSDSDSDFGESQHERRLPAGGDTSELGEPRGIAKVLDRARLKGGNFLIGNSLGIERAGTNRRKPVIQLPVGLGQRTSGRVVMKRSSQSTIHTIASESLRSVRLAKRSVESLHRVTSSHKKRAWNPRNWQVQYVGVSGMRDLWRQRQAQKRRQELKGKIGVRYSVENAPTSN